MWVIRGISKYNGGIKYVSTGDRIEYDDITKATPFHERHSAQTAISAEWNHEAWDIHPYEITDDKIAAAIIANKVR